MGIPRLLGRMHGRRQVRYSRIRMGSWLSSCADTEQVVDVGTVGMVSGGVQDISSLRFWLGCGGVRSLNMTHFCVRSSLINPQLLSTCC
ncbi:hypothetical protein [Iningainema tapete]|uniref:Uncharacterized protein n=1 Tax=Iningainema tapete BLCC-T55 TaxID=2748662 RepID=A0A8J6XDC7_9CYAN|nr:hypothetical protein [Iningainema tapete]MBD2773870.1 hypothetical protein [Iningainema tapete BLCC-T55]